MAANAREQSCPHAGVRTHGVRGWRAPGGLRNKMLSGFTSAFTMPWLCWKARAIWQSKGGIGGGLAAGQASV